MSKSPARNETAAAMSPVTNGHSNGTEEATTPETPKLSRREEVALQRAAKKKAEEDNLSFKPQIAHRKPKKSKTPDDVDSPPKPAEAAHDRLYSDAMKKKEKAATPPRSEFSFQPTVPHRQNSINASKARAKSPIQCSNRLYQTAARQPRAEEPAGTFKPNISKRAKSLERNPSVSTADRLYAQAVIAKEKQQKMREQVQKQEDSTNTFTPRTNEKGKARAGDRGKAAPISERMQSYIEARNKKLEEARLEKEAREAAEFTGRPSIGGRKGSASTSTSKGTNVFDRLSKAAPPPAPEPVKETFQPTIFTAKRSQSASRATRRSAPMAGNDQVEVHERLYKEAEQRRRELAAERDLARQEEEKQLTFAPQLPARPSDGTHEVPKTDENGAPLSVFKRLNSISKEEIIKKNEKIKADQEMEDCTFHPHINPASANLFQASEPVHVRLMKEAERQKELKKHFELRKEEEELMDCTFAPDLTKSMSNLFVGRQSGEFGRGSSFAFSEAGDTEHSSPTRSEEQSVPEEAKVATSPPTASGLKPVSAGTLPSGLTALQPPTQVPPGLRALSPQHHPVN